MQHGIHNTNSARMVRQATVCMLVVAFAVGIVRFGTGGYGHDMESSGFKIENTSSSMQMKTEQLPWLKKN